MKTRCITYERVKDPSQQEDLDKQIAKRIEYVQANNLEVVATFQEVSNSSDFEGREVLKTLMRLLKLYYRPESERNIQYLLVYSPEKISRKCEEFRFFTELLDIMEVEIVFTSRQQHPGDFAHGVLEGLIDYFKKLDL